MAQAEGLQVWIDDRNPIFRRGLRAILENHALEVSGESTKFSPEPDLAGSDLLIFEGNSFSLQQAVRLADAASVRLVALVQEPAQQLLVDLIDAGVSAVLARNRLTPPGLVGSLHSAASGQTSVDSDLLAGIVAGCAVRDSATEQGRLSDREIAVLRLLADGDDTNNIASELAYSPRTVKNIVHDVLMKLNCRNRAHAVAYATRIGLI